MKYFISFRYTGETTQSLQEVLYPVRDALVAAGHEVYLSLDDLETWGNDGLSMPEKFHRTFAHLDSCDAILVIVRSPDRSEGMLMEVGFALARGIPIYLVVAVGVQTYIRDVATRVAEFEVVLGVQAAVVGLVSDDSAGTYMDQ